MQAAVHWNTNGTCYAWSPGAMISPCSLRVTAFPALASFLFDALGTLWPCFPPRCCKRWALSAFRLHMVSIKAGWPIGQNSFFFFSPLYHFSVPWDFTSELLGNKLECSIWRWKGETRETAQWIPVLLSSLWLLGEGPIFAMRLLPHSWSGVCCHQENTVNMEPADFGYALALL